MRRALVESAPALHQRFEHFGRRIERGGHGHRHRRRLVLAGVVMCGELDGGRLSIDAGVVPDLAVVTAIRRDHERDHHDRLGAARDQCRDGLIPPRGRPLPDPSGTPPAPVRPSAPGTWFRAPGRSTRRWRRGRRRGARSGPWRCPGSHGHIKAAKAIAGDSLIHENDSQVILAFENTILPFVTEGRKDGTTAGSILEGRHRHVPASRSPSVVPSLRHSVLRATNSPVALGPMMVEWLHVPRSPSLWGVPVKNTLLSAQPGFISRPIVCPSMSQLAA